jgi:hypothetical protein
MTAAPTLGAALACPASRLQLPGWPGEATRSRFVEVEMQHLAGEFDGRS